MHENKKAANLRWATFSTHTLKMSPFWVAHLTSGRVFAHLRAAQVGKQPFGVFRRASGQTHAGAQVGKHTYRRANGQFGAFTFFTWFDRFSLVSFKISFIYFYTVFFVLRTFVKISSYSSLPYFETRLLTLLIKLLLCGGIPVENSRKVSTLYQEQSAKIYRLQSSST